MASVASLEQQVRDLSPEELAEFREWFALYDAEAWDRQFEADVNAGRLDALAERALQAHAAGWSTRLERGQMMQDHPEIKAVEMTRRIREAHHAELEGKTPEERLAFYREKARALHSELGRLEEPPHKPGRRV